MLLTHFVPAAEKQHDSWEETSLHKAEGDSEGDHSANVVNSLDSDRDGTLRSVTKRANLVEPLTQITINVGKKMDGLDLARIMFDGTSKRRYATKKMDRTSE